MLTLYCGECGARHALSRSNRQVCPSCGKMAAWLTRRPYTPVTPSRPEPDNSPSLGFGFDFGGGGGGSDPTPSGGDFDGFGGGGGFSGGGAGGDI